MNIENLKEGMVVPNYRKLCSLLGVSVKSGNSKKYQLIDWERNFRWEKSGHKFIITEVFEEAEIKVHNYNIKSIKEFINDNYELEYIFDTNLNNIDLNKTSIHSKETILVKCEMCGNIHEKKINRLIINRHNHCNLCCMSSGERIIHNALTYLDLDFEKEYSFDDLKSDKGFPLRFDFALFENGQLLCLIEFDGQFHDHQLSIIANDKLKNNYCKINNIKLIRIHHSKFKNLELELMKQLLIIMKEKL